MYELRARVSVDLPVIPEEERQCTEGTIIESRLKFPGTSFEVKMVLIRFDKNYVLPRYQKMGGIFELQMKEDDPRIRRI